MHPFAVSQAAFAACATSIRFRACLQPHNTQIKSDYADQYGVGKGKPPLSGEAIALH